MGYISYKKGTIKARINNLSISKTSNKFHLIRPIDNPYGYKAIPTNIKDITKLDVLLGFERQELKDTFISWQGAKDQKQWIKADKLRYEFALWDQTMSCCGIWYPIFEHNLHCQKRAFIRMKIFNINVYPWDITDVDDFSGGQ